MTIIDAINSGYPFKRRCWDSTAWITQDYKLILSTNDILAEDWEIERPAKRYYIWALKRIHDGKLCFSADHYDDNLTRPDGSQGLTTHEFLAKLESEYIDV